MFIKELSLTNFRIYQHLEANMPEGNLILVGRNAQGKTSLLEAIYYLAGAQSPHKGSHRQLIHWLSSKEDEQPYLRVGGKFEIGNEIRRVEIVVQSNSSTIDGPNRIRKDVVIDGVNKNNSSLNELVNVVMFLPQNMILVEGSPSDRRNYLDRTLSQIDSTYARSVRNYYKVLSQRNSLLKTLQGKYQENVKELEFWDNKLCDIGSVVMGSRARALFEISNYVNKIHTDFTDGSEYLELKYFPGYDKSTGGGNQLSLGLEAPFASSVLQEDSDFASGMQNNLIQLRSEEIRRGVTLIGPHRDDFRFIMSGFDLGVFGSRGQGRTAVLSLKFAEMEWMYHHSGDWPILLLDEVLAELDLQRRSDLLNRLYDADQVIVTTTDKGMIPDQFSRRARIWQVSGGTLKADSSG
tara:strand:+ start:163 stop:1386 length:1224 start_codon:yes stop_codon:yes gene_type:complete